MLARSDVAHLPLPDESVDLIFTDPPYSHDSIPLYARLVREAYRILKRGAFLAVLCGGAYLDEVFSAMSIPQMIFFWKYEMQFTGSGGGVFWMNGNITSPVISRSKPILAYSKGTSLPRKATLSPIEANAADKKWHHWGQDVSSARYFIDCFSKLGDLVCDPMVGGGTTGIACQLLNRKFIGFDIDPVACRTTYDRLENSDAVVNLPLFAHG